MFETLLCFLLCFINYLTQIAPFFFFFRSSRPEVFCKKDVFRNFAKFAGKHLCQSLFFDKVAGLRPENIFSYRTPLVAASVFFKYLFVTSHTLHFTLFTFTSTYFISSFSVFNFVFRRSFPQKKEKKKIYL